MSKNIVFMGTPSFAVPCLELLAGGDKKSNYRVAAVYTQPDKEAGRGMALAASPVKQRAIDLGLQVLQPDTLKDTSAIEQMKKFKPDVVVVAAYGKLIPVDLLSIPQFGYVNVHPSLLPLYRGSSPISEAILRGDRATGVTIMLLDAGMDSGPVLSQKSVTITSEDTGGSLSDRLARTGAELLMEVLPRWLEGRIKAQPQDAGQATFTRQVTKQDGEIDWKLPAIDIWRRVRAYYPWPGTYAIWQGKRLKVNEAIPFDIAHIGQPGKVVILPPGSPAVVGVETGVGVLGLLRIQLEGKQEASAEEFIRGQRSFISSSLL
jgi:methionyl-tRNA formyltransferase